MRVLHVISGIDPSNGGPTTALRGLTAAQKQAGLEPRVLTTWQVETGPANAPTFEAAGVPVTLVGPARGKLSRHPDLRRTVEAAVADADVVHVHSLWEQPQHEAMRAARRAGVPYVVRACGGLKPWALRQGRLHKRLYLRARLLPNLRRAAAMHYTTPGERDAARPLGLRVPTIVEPNGTDLAAAPPPDPVEARRRVVDRVPELAAHAGRPWVVFVGRLHEVKGLDLLVAAFAEADRRAGVGATLILAGPAQELEVVAAVQRDAARLGVADRLVLPGLLTPGDAADLAAAADVAALLSRSENFGISAVEALAVGTPVLLSDQVGLTEFVAGRGVGEVVPLQIEPAADALAGLLADADRRGAAGRAGRALAVERFGWPAIARRWADHYARLRGRPS